MFNLKKLIIVSILILILSSYIPYATYAAEESKFYITNISPKEFRPSEMAHIDITIKNIGTKPAYYVATDIVTVTSGRSIMKVIGESKKDIGIVTGDDEETVKYEIRIDKDAEKGVYYIPLKVTWKDEYDEESQTKSEELYLGVSVVEYAKEAKIDITNATTIPEYIQPGGTGILNIEMKNVGSIEVSSLKLKLLPDPPFTPAGSDLEEYFSKLRPGETIVAKFNIGVDVSAESKLYDLDLVLEYEDENKKDNLKNSTIGLMVRGTPKIYIQEIVVEPGKLTQGTEGLLMVRVINSGTDDAVDVKIRISEKDILTESHYFIGEISPGQSETATFGINVDKEAEAGDYGLGIDISFKDKYSESFSTFKIYEVSIAKDEPLIATEYVIAIVGVAILALIGYVFVTTRSRE